MKTRFAAPDYSGVFDSTESEAARRRLWDAWEELTEVLLSDPPVLGEVFERVGPRHTRRLLDALTAAWPGCAPLTVGRQKTDDWKVLLGLAVLAEWKGPKPTWSDRRAEIRRTGKRTGALVPRGEFAPWFCAQMQRRAAALGRKITYANCKTVFLTLRKQLR